MLPMRTFPVSLMFTSVPRTGGKAGLALPIRTFPVSLVLAGPPRTGGKAGLALPIRTLPLSEMTVGFSLVVTESLFTFVIGSSQM
jgi:hypothetical protein